MFRMKMMILAALVLLLALSGPSSAREEKAALRISGSTTVLPIAQRAAEVYLGLHPELALSVSGTGSGDGLKAIVEGSVDIANSSRDLKSKEAARAEEAGVKLRRQAVALDCVAVVVNPENPVTELSLAQLKGIYDGQFKNWRELGGPDRPIVAVNRDVSSGTFEVWLEKVLKGERVRPDAQVQASNGGVAQAVAGNKNAVGYVGLGYLSPEIKAVRVEGVEPSVANVQQNLYPISRELYMFTREGGAQTAEDFIKFLTGPEGQKLVTEEGFVPLGQ